MTTTTTHLASGPSFTVCKTQNQCPSFLPRPRMKTGLRKLRYKQIIHAHSFWKANQLKALSFLLTWITITSFINCNYFFFSFLEKSITFVNQRLRRWWKLKVNKTSWNIKNYFNLLFKIKNTSEFKYLIYFFNEVLCSFLTVWIPWGTVLMTSYVRHSKDKGGTPTNHFKKVYTLNVSRIWK